MIDLQIKIENGEIHKYVNIKSYSKDVLMFLLVLEEFTQKMKDSIKKDLLEEVNSDE